MSSIFKLLYSAQFYARIKTCSLNLYNVNIFLTEKKKNVNKKSVNQLKVCANMDTCPS